MGVCEWTGGSSARADNIGYSREKRSNKILAAERYFFIDNLLVQIYFIIEMIWWTGLAPDPP